MGNGSAIVFAGIAPHPPIMVPEVGHEAIAEVRGSIEAMAELTKRVIASGAATVVLISPHAPLDATAFVAYQGPNLYGDFGAFRAREAIVEAELDQELLQQITRAANEDNYDVRPIPARSMDHGTMVPLYFLQRNGWRGQVVALGYSFLSNAEHLGFGACLGRAIETVGRPVAIIASGDLSHRLQPGAPAGYDEQAHLFDQEICSALRANTTERIVNLNQDVRKRAGECGYRSLLVALGALPDSPPSCEVLNYEAPFGVGYLVAQLSAVPATVAAEPALSEVLSVVEGSAQPARRARDTENDQLPSLARNAVETFVLTNSQLDPNDQPEELTATRAACFVSLKTTSGDLRGCIGTVEPVYDSLAQEVISNAIQAASHDPRFPPVTAAELPQLHYSVDVLSAVEPTTFAELDPKNYGVVVEDESGKRRGLLLPDIEGVDTAAKQVEIAARKAGIPAGKPVRLFRFRVQRYRER